MSMASRRVKSAEVGSRLSQGGLSPARQSREVPSPYEFRHAWSDGFGLNSICMKCRKTIATNRDEWSLLAFERMHVCGAPPGRSPATGEL